MYSFMSRYAKAGTAALTIAYALYQVATGVDSPGGTGVTQGEWIGLGVSTAVSLLAVWYVPNAPELPPVPRVVVTTDRPVSQLREYTAEHPEGRPVTGQQTVVTADNPPRLTPPPDFAD